MIQYKPVFKRLFALIISLVSATIGVQSQTYLPRSYWTFDNPSNVFSDSMGLFNLDPNFYGSGYAIGNNTAGTGVGKFMTLNSTSGYIRMGQLPTDSAFTIEFLFRPGYNFKETRFFYRLDGAITAKMNYPYITFNTTHRSNSGASVSDELRIDLDGIGRKSYGYYIDGNWHHIVFKFNAKTGVKEIWVDGQCPAGFSKTVTPTGYFINNTSVNRDLLLNATINYIQYHGDYDEMAIYSYGLPANMIYKHYLDFVSNKHYSFQNSTIPVPSPSAVSGPIDLNEFPPGHPNVTVSVLDQLKTFPVPRYKQGHTLLPNFNWIDPLYTSSYMQPGVSQTQSVNNSIALQTELVTKFNYMLYLGYGGSPWGDAWINLANQNPSWKASTTVLRLQLSNPLIASQNLPNDHYLQNSSGQFINENGTVTSQKIWRPTAPTSSYVNDGLAVRNNLSSAFVGRLTRPIDFVNENGEAFPMISNTALAMDPVVTAAKNASGLGWEEFLAQKYMQHSTIPYRDQFMNLSIFNSNTKYSEYRIDGHRTYQFRYEQSRLINTPINGKRYSTLDFYVKFPANWRYWSGPWHGWQWVVESRKYEYALGDSLFSPFVSPGWDANNETHVRPAQYLGLLKCLGMMGAEFYYPAYFNTASSYQPPNPPPNDPRGYIWQNVMPSYSQAVTSRYEDLLRNGTILEGDVPNDPYSPQWNAYNFWTGDLRKIVVVRKNRTKKVYAITGTIQPNSNMAGNAELESVATITLDGQTLKFKVRRQGSTYIYDNTNTSAPVFYQLDEWHQYQHPYYWTKDLNVEAENYDIAGSGAVIKTSVPAGTPAGNFTNFTSYVSFNSISDLTYNVEPRGTSASNYYLWVRARSKDGTSTGFTVTLNGSNSRTFDCIKDTAWTWYRFDNSNTAVVYNALALQNHVLKITPTNLKIEIDKISLTTTSGAFFNNNPAPCSNAASISASGPLSFCQGGSVTLTASNGTSYLWSTGATTKSITVSTPGTFTVTVTNNGVPAVSSPVTVTVHPLPTAFITANGPTTFCSGGSVVLTSNTAQGYFWSPGGQTTQSITVSSAGSYTVRVTDNNGCTNTSAATTVTVNSPPAATITAGGPTTFCQGGTVTLTSSTGSSYLWSNGSTTGSITVNASGSYTVRVTGSNGCSATSAVTTVTVNALPNATISANGPLTFNQGGSVVLTASSGSAYLWSPGNQTTQSITVTSSGSYSVRVTGSNGCSATSSPVVVTVNSGVSYAITPSGPTTFCQGGSVTLSVPSGTAYLWSTGATTQSIVVTSSGTYSATVYSGSGSVPAGPVTVTVNPLPVATITANGATTFCSGSSVVLTASSGNAYLWTPGGQTTQSITVTSSGSYAVRVTNSNGCSATSAATNVTVTNCSTCPVPTGLFASNVTASTAVLNWTPPGVVSNYQVEIINTLTNYVYTTGLFSGTFSSLTIAVQANRTYRWRIRAYCSGTPGAWSVYHVFTTPVLREQTADPGTIFNDNLLTPDIDSRAFFDNHSDHSLLVYPNPVVNGLVALSFYSDIDEKGTLLISDFTGREIYRTETAIVQEHNRLDVKLPDCKPGAYFVQLITKRKNYFARFIAH